MEKHTDLFQIIIDQKTNSVKISSNNIEILSANISKIAIEDIITIKSSDKNYFEKIAFILYICFPFINVNNLLDMISKLCDIECTENDVILEMLKQKIFQKMRRKQ